MNTEYALSRHRVRWEKPLQIMLFLTLGWALFANLNGHVFQPLLDAVADLDWPEHILMPSIWWAAMGLLLLAYRTLLWLNYREFAPTTDWEAPMLTIIIPAYNEGAMVEKTIDSVASAAYPRDKLEIFVVDDGSRDDTWTYITRAAERHPGLVTTLRFPENRGKRAALSAGFRRGRGDVMVTIDSDSIIEHNTLLAIAGPFKDPKVGAVAGRVSVYNRRQGIIPRMLHVRFILSFDFLRAAESGYRTVYCCPGALAGYRAKVVRDVLPRWETQTFLGAACTFGEDRALTNYILEAGYDSVYQRSAVVHTLVPTTYKKLTKMLLRWDRSYVREELRLARILWKRPLVARITTLIERTITNLRFPISYATLGMLLVLMVHNPETLLRVGLSIGTVSLLYTLYYLRSERSWDFIYGIFYAYFSFVALTWIFPYAVVTARARSWLTR
ncbi:MAG: glycosyltransferase [Gammaproteobacteria bacterium]|nr:glycosyltransferase [Gammaproteobacteria bacterium]